MLGAGPMETLEVKLNDIERLATEQFSNTKEKLWLLVKIRAFESQMMLKSYREQLDYYKRQVYRYQQQIDEYENIISKSKRKKVTTTSS